jgi:predicted flap endonuclease-1-like 5' DNA nuclease
MPWWFRTIFWALLLCFLAGLLLGLVWWWLRRRNEHQSYEQLRLEREAESDRLRLRISSLQSKQERLAELEAEVANLREQAERLTALQGQLSDARSQANQVPELERTIAELRVRAERAGQLEEEAAELRRQHADEAGERQRCALELEASTDRVTELEKRVEELSDVRAEAVVAVEVATPSGTEEAAASGDGAWQEGTTVLGTPGANHSDNLRAINGIGPVMERTLNELGIQTWEQIAAFTPADIERVSAAIKTFPGRIERDDWVGGAKELLATGHVPGEDTSARALSSFRRKAED